MALSPVTPPPIPHPTTWLTPQHPSGFHVEITLPGEFGVTLCAPDIQTHPVTQSAVLFYFFFVSLPPELQLPEGKDFVLPGIQGGEVRDRSRAVRPGWEEREARKVQEPS